MTNFEGRYAVNIVIDTLEAENLEKIFLLHFDVSKKQIIQPLQKCSIKPCLYYGLKE